MIPAHIHQGEPLPTYLARKSRNLLFNPAKKAQAEKDRQTRETTNFQENLLLRLPAELRNQIYDLLLPSKKEIKRSLHHRSQGRLPPILHVCRQLRRETYPLFFSRNTPVITLQHLTQHVRSPQRIRSTINVLPDYGTLSWRNFRIETCSRCFHADGFAVLANIDVLIDRDAQTVSCQPRGASYLRPCCRMAQKNYSKKLTAAIQGIGFQDGGKRLRRDHFERLAIKMDENRQDWLKSSRRVIPQGRFG